MKWTRKCLKIAYAKKKKRKFKIQKRIKINISFAEEGGMQGMKRK